MHRISLTILLSLVQENDTKDSFDNLSGAFAQRLSDKLLDRTLMTRSMDHGALDHATLAKSGARARPAGQRRTVVRKGLPEGLLDKFPMANLKARVKASWRNSRLARLVQPGAGAVLEQPDHQEMRIPSRIEVDLGRTATASADEGSGYLGHLAAFPGVEPEVVTPEEEASIRIAGLTPIETPERLSPRKASDLQEKGEMYVPEVSEQSDGTQSTDVSRMGTPRSAQIDSDIDSSIMNDPRRKAPGHRNRDVETDSLDSPRSTDSGIEDIVSKAWRYSHGVLPTPTKKALMERQFPRTSK
eukprot:gnl/MRDRNA2_/MRDRNA2_91893_c0_seq1.p1 gnl/MRDRNA2_/MRDRNA2_91893_c0~~gnl/MRDRNA2_/MRDRNA2_91893_c0_seq1.p1  ORF type:complete len:300 (-),score=58.92 gnl/MRDRNA2_/MRDRNA2_91893_c0_seq1:75-974(-)